MPDRISDAAFTLHFEQRSRYLYALVSGPEDSFEITLAYWTAIAAECGRRGVRRVLVVDALAGEPATPAELELRIRSLQGIGLEEVHVAFVEPVDAHLAQMEHAEILAREQGFRIRVFSSITAAELWLRHGME
jgi:hypothetical protein